MSGFVEYNANPKQAHVGDCVVRALAKATGQSWQKVFAGLAAEAFEQADMPSANHVWGAYLRKHGFRRYVIPDSCPDCYTVADFCADHPRGTYVLALAKHTLTVQDGCAYDTWDSTREPVIYFWTKKED